MAGGDGRGRTGRGELDGCIMHWVDTSLQNNQDTEFDALKVVSAMKVNKIGNVYLFFFSLYSFVFFDIPTKNTKLRINQLIQKKVYLILDICSH